MTKILLFKDTFKTQKFDNVNSLCHLLSQSIQEGVSDLSFPLVRDKNIFLSAVCGEPDRKNTASPVVCNMLFSAFIHSTKIELFDKTR